MALEEALKKLGSLLAREPEPAQRPLLVMLAGSNGAGKSTFYEAYLASLPLPFVNADRIASEVRSGRLAAPPQLAGRPVDEVAQRMADEQRQACILLRRRFSRRDTTCQPAGGRARHRPNERLRSPQRTTA